MQNQLNLFNGNDLRDEGIKRSVDHADDVIDSWSDRAYRFLNDYIKSNREFMAEDVRVASINQLPEPPSLRAWGGVFVRAAKSGLIVRIGFRNVINHKAHSTPASVWRAVC